MMPHVGAAGGASGGSHVARTASNISTGVVRATEPKPDLPVIARPRLTQVFRTVRHGYRRCHRLAAGTAESRRVRGPRGRGHDPKPFDLRRTPMALRHLY